MNCDCGYHKEARTNFPSGKWCSAKCQFCKEMLGIGEWWVLGKIRGIGDLDALTKWDKQQKDKK